jgi:hypothetical protein
MHHPNLSYKKGVAGPPTPAVNDIPDPDADIIVAELCQSFAAASARGGMILTVQTFRTIRAIADRTRSD